MNDGKDEGTSELPRALANYTLPGVLHFIQSEWRKFERQRNEWELERSDLKARVAFLEGERNAMDNLKTDLVRRIKMLEYSLRQERLKAEKGDTNPSAKSALLSDQTVPNGPIKSEKRNILSNNELLQFTKGFGHSRSREILKSYLNEAEKLLATTSAVKKTPLDVASVPVVDTRQKMIPSSTYYTTQEPIDSNAIVKKDLAEISTSPLLSDERANTLKANKSNTIKPDRVLTINSNRKNELSDNWKGVPYLQGYSTANIEIENNDLSPIESEEKNNLNSSTTIISPSNSLENLFWNPQPPLRNHYDSVRSVYFHPRELALVSGSEDHTVKFWRITTVVNPSPAEESKLVATFRGHTGPVTSVSISNIDEQCYSSSTDASIKIWNLPPINKPAYSPHNRSICTHTLVGHSDAVWEVQSSPNARLLVSASSDGSLKLWDVSNPCLKASYWYTGPTKHKLGEFHTPTSVCWESSNKIVGAYRDCSVKIFDLETRTISLELESNSTFVTGHNGRQIFVTAHEDGYIKIFDNKTGKLVKSIKAHDEGVSSISIAPGGDTIVSGGYDGMLKWWDLNTFTLINMKSAYKPRESTGVWSIEHHKAYKNVMAAGGCDSSVLIYIK